RKNFTSASGKTTVPMSRPFNTAPRLPKARCRSTLARLTPGIVETTDDIAVTVSVRIWSVTSWPLSKTANEAGSPSRSISIVFASATTASLLPGSTCASITASATARYIEPVSMYRSCNERASMRPSVDLPEPDGPSIAIIIRIWDHKRHKVEPQTGTNPKSEPQTGTNLKAEPQAPKTKE